MTDTKDKEQRANLGTSYFGGKHTELEQKLKSHG